MVTPPKIAKPIALIRDRDLFRNKDLFNCIVDVPSGERNSSLLNSSYLNPINSNPKPHAEEVTNSQS